MLRIVLACGLMIRYVVQRAQRLPALGAGVLCVLLYVRTPHLNLLPQDGEKRPEQDGERSKRGPLISIFSHRMGRRGWSRMGRGVRIESAKW